MGVAAEQRSIPNAEIADALDRVATLLEAQDANPYKVRAYHTAAETIRVHPVPLEEILEQGGVEAVEALPTIGSTIAAHVAELVHRGGLSLLDRLEGEVSPERLLATVPGIGPELAARIHEDLAVDTLEELEVAAHDGRLEALRGFGPRRVQVVRDTLAGLLGRSARHRARRRRWLEARGTAKAESVPMPRPQIATLLALDAEYRKQAAAGTLRCIAPRRFNPKHEAWLPVLHVLRDGWDMTALFSNTALAHQLERTNDWVVIYYRRDGDEGQCTIVTETRGPLAGRRVVRGREQECAQAQEG
jgi:hypothetical protein